VSASLRQSKSSYRAHVAHCAEITEALQEAKKTKPNYQQYQHVVFCVHDQHGVPIEDYLIEFYQDDGDENNDDVTEKVQCSILQDVHVYRKARHYRSFFFNLTALRKEAEKDPAFAIHFSIVAAHPSKRVEYLNPPEEINVGVPVFTPDNHTFLHPNGSLLIDLTLHRKPQPQVFRIDPFEP